MAKNRTMAIKHSMAKKWAMKEALENAKIEMCCKTIPNGYKPISYNQESVFYSKYAIQRRIDALIGVHYPIEDFLKEWSSVYEYLIIHTVPQARQHFSTAEISLIKLKLLEKGG